MVLPWASTEYLQALVSTCVKCLIVLLRGFRERTYITLAWIEFGQRGMRACELMNGNLRSPVLSHLQHMWLFLIMALLHSLFCRLGASLLCVCQWPPPVMTSIAVELLLLCLTSAGTSLFPRRAPAEWLGPQILDSDIWLLISALPLTTLWPWTVPQFSHLNVERMTVSS